MYNFIKNREDKYITEDDIIKIEEKYNIKFPKVLREYYLEYDGDEIKLCYININGHHCGISDIIPLKIGDYTFEEVVDKFRENDIFNIIGDDMVPFGSNEGGDDFFWNKKNENVYLYYWDDVKNPIFICDDIKSLFEIMEKSVILYQRGLIY